MVEADIAQSRGDRIRASAYAPIVATLVPALLSAIVVLMIGWIFYTVTDSTWNPMSGAGYTSPQVVAEESVPQGGTVHVTATKCVSEDVGAYGQLNLVRISPSPTLFVDYGGLRSGGTKTRGCLTRAFSNILPADLPPGVWKIVGIDTVVQLTGSKDAKRTWETAPFTVTAVAP